MKTILSSISLIGLMWMSGTVYGGEIATPASASVPGAVELSAELDREIELERALVEETSGDIKQERKEIDAGWSSFDVYPRLAGDVNGDGYDDIVAFGYYGVLVSLSTGYGFTAPVYWLYDFSYYYGGWTSYDLYPRQLGDVNGDGLKDIVGFGAYGVLVSLSTGYGFTPATYWLYDFSYYNGGWTSYNTYPRLVGDVNGDGFDDIVGFGYYGALVSLSTGAGFTSSYYWIYNFSYYNGGWTSNDTYPRKLGDVNGDGLKDIVGFGSYGVLVSLSSGYGFYSPVYWIYNYSYYNGGWTSHNLYPREVGDVNGDGYDDVVGFGGYGVLVSLSTGYSFSSLSYWIYNYSYYNGGWTSHNLYPRTLADVNHDYRYDVLGFGGYGTLVSLSTGYYFTAPAYWIYEYNP